MTTAKESKPKKPWQGSRWVEMRLLIPCDVVMLCELTDTDPDEIVHRFLSCLGGENDKRNSRAAKQASADFFIRCGFGKDFYCEEEIRQMFTEMARVHDLWMDDVTSSKFLDLHSHWRKKYHKQWFKKWHRKIRKRKDTD